jgi:hypothetical protein
MNIFNIHSQVIESYKSYINSFINIRDERIKKTIEEEIDSGKLWPEPLIQLNPSYANGGTIDELCKNEGLHNDLSKIFNGIIPGLYLHQKEAILLGINGKDFVVTSGTGSGKSLIYLTTIFNSILKNRKPGIKALLVFPMNALINSQKEEIDLFSKSYGDNFPISYAVYTGQEGEEKRQEIMQNIPDILLTNYMMLELIMTRSRESIIRDSMRDNLRYLLFDELHTYRGRQGADVAMLIRRIKSFCKNPLLSIGTSATMASGVSRTEQKQAVAKVASEIFASDFTTDQIIDETLRSLTEFNGLLPDKQILAESINSPVILTGSSEEFLSHPLLIWLENRIALRRDDTGFIFRGKPLSLSEMVFILHEESGEAANLCRKALESILNWAETLNIKEQEKKPSKTYLPFKIHQFISQTGNAYVTLEAKGTREITIQPGRYIRKNDEDRYIFPLVFSRYSGYEYLCVVKDFENGILKPRDADDLPPRISRDDLIEEGTERKRRKLTDEDFSYGYLLIPDEDEQLWSEEDLDLLPDSWFRTRRGIRSIDNYFEYRLPKKIWFDENGKFSNEPKYKLSGWFIPARLLVDPTAGIVYDLKTNETTKLMRLGNEGRSTATTIISFSILKSLHDNGIPLNMQKILSFTDNRQDASLQAGHFNDFITLSRIRSSIYQSLLSATDQQLTIDNIASSVFQKLNLPETEYSRNPSPDPTWPDTENEKALKDYLLLRIIYDLKRGWRYNTPNLEQCGLLEVIYEKIEAFSRAEQFWKDFPLLQDLTPKKRETIVLQVLNFFRTSYALDYYRLDPGNIEELEARLKNRLDTTKTWSLDQNESIEVPVYLVVQRPGRTRKKVFTSSVGPRSYMGKYIRKQFKDNGLEPLHGEEFNKFISMFLETLFRGNYLSKTKIEGEVATIGYRLRMDKVIWHLGDGTVKNDELRLTSYRNVEVKPNQFFQVLYKIDYNQFHKSLTGREHTGQIKNEQRKERENDFREGKISALFCSPTMELGINIASLNVVHMRNVPPNPANYAQRSGRAGRSGQAALIFTYCSYFSPHDRNYFNNSHQMVSGIVVPPRLDLINEELIYSHFNAYILMELGLSSLHNSVGDVLELDDPAIPVKSSLTVYIEEQLSALKDDILKNFRKTIVDIYPKMKESWWFSDEWLEQKYLRFKSNFDAGFDRWRNLYRHAQSMIANAKIVLLDPRIKSDNPQRGDAIRQQKIGIRQRDLLLNDIQDTDRNNSEFYVFRYLASEGFLPGYNFVRLPIRAFLGMREKGEFISRSRFLALNEFGPKNIIYHDGSKYRIDRLNLTDAEMRLHSMKVSCGTGYIFLDDEGKGVNNDPITNVPLRGEDQVTMSNILLELCESQGNPLERISCEEEERSRQGYESDRYFSIPKGMESVRKVTLSADNKPLLNLYYAPAARLVGINRKWRIAKEEEGFAIGKVSGIWKQKKDIENQNPSDPAIKVQLYTWDTADIIYIQPVESLALSYDGVITLTYALKRAIEKLFQIEENEIDAWIMGKKESSNILLFEAAEGSLGILSQLIENNILLNKVFIEAYKVCHFDPATQTDTRPEEPMASYENLLSYYNQPWHDIIDRHSIKAALELLMICTPDSTDTFDNYQEQFDFLISNLDKASSTEEKFIRYLYNYGIRLPDKTQVNIPGYYVNADFVYSDNQALIFCDGSVHDPTDQQSEDKHKRQLLRDAGYDVIEWHYTEPIKQLIERRKDIFRKIR